MLGYEPVTSSHWLNHKATELRVPELTILFLFRLQRRNHQPAGDPDQEGHQDHSGKLQRDLGQVSHDLSFVASRV